MRPSRATLESAMSVTAKPDAPFVIRRAKALLGKDAELWLYRQNRNLASLAPFEMAQSAAGAAIVLQELERIGKADA
jgi:hypothetical protein